MEPVSALDITLPPRGSRGLLRALHRQLRAAIVDGRLRAGLRLPSTRVLARTCGVSRNLAIAAYELLLSEGFVTTRPGGGTFVAAVTTERKERRLALQTSDRRLNPLWRSPPSLFGYAEPSRKYEFDFAVGLPDTGPFPFDVWRRLSARAVRKIATAPADYLEPAGRPELREAIAKHVSFARAVACSADDVVVTSGAQQAFDLLARVLVTSGKTVVAVEDPGYPPLVAAFAAAGAKVNGIPVDSEGIVLDRVPSNAHIVCVTPSHQFPLGTVLSLQRRRALLELARRKKGIVIEDDYDSEFRHEGGPLDALQTLDRDHVVFYVGTFSKSLFPALRLGFVVTPTWAKSALLLAKQRSDWHVPVFSQDALAAFIAEGHLARHVRRMRKVYGLRREALLHAVAERGAGRFEIVPSSCGLHVCTRLRARLKASTLAALAAERGIRVQPLERFAIARRAPNGIAFGLGRIDAKHIEEGIARLCRLLD